MRKEGEKKGNGSYVLAGPQPGRTIGPNQHCADKPTTRAIVVGLESDQPPSASQVKAF